MRHNLILRSSILLVCSCIFIYSSCNKQPYEPPYNTAIGYVIGKEVCNTDVSKDYWLINIISSSSVQQQYGDTLTLNGVKYSNVIKTIGVTNNLKIVGQKVGLDFNISTSQIITTGCSVSIPITYQLKEATIINIAEAR
jgi:hypothetical protein